VRIPGGVLVAGEERNLALAAAAAARERERTRERNHTDAADGGSPVRDCSAQGERIRRRAFCWAVPVLCHAFPFFFLSLSFY
jgi:hypothetical protein